MATQAISPASVGTTSELGTPQLSLSSNAQVVAFASAGDQDTVDKSFVLPTAVPSYSLQVTPGCGVAPYQLAFSGGIAVGAAGIASLALGRHKVFNSDSVVTASGLDAGLVGGTQAHPPIGTEVPFAVACPSLNTTVYRLGAPADDTPRVFTRGIDPLTFGSPTFRVVQLLPVPSVDTGSVGGALISRQVHSLSLSTTQCYTGQAGPPPDSVVGPAGIEALQLTEPKGWTYRTYLQAGLGDMSSFARVRVSREIVRPGLLRISCSSGVVQANLSGAIYVAPAGHESFSFTEPGFTGGTQPGQAQSVTPTGFATLELGGLRGLYRVTGSGIDSVELGANWPSLWVRAFTLTTGDTLGVGSTQVHNRWQLVVPTGVESLGVALPEVYIFTPTAGDQAEVGLSTVWLQYQVVAPQGWDTPSVGYPVVGDKAQYLGPSEVPSAAVGLAGVYLRDRTVSPQGETYGVVSPVSTRNVNQVIRPAGSATLEFARPQYAGRNPNQVLFPITDPAAIGQQWVSNWIRSIGAPAVSAFESGATRVWNSLQKVAPTGVQDTQVGLEFFDKSPKVTLALRGNLEFGATWVSRTPLEVLLRRHNDYLSFGGSAIGWSPWPVSAGGGEQTSVGLALVVETFNRVTTSATRDYLEVAAPSVKEMAIIPSGLEATYTGGHDVRNLDRSLAVPPVDGAQVGYSRTQTNRIKVGVWSMYGQVGTPLVANQFVVPTAQQVLRPQIDTGEVSISLVVGLGTPQIEPTGEDYLKLGVVSLSGLPKLDGYSLNNTLLVGDLVVSAVQRPAMEDPTLDMLEVGAISISPWIVYARPDVPYPRPYSGDWERTEFMEVSEPLVAHRVRSLQPVVRTYPDQEPYWERFGATEVREVNAPQWVMPAGVDSFDIWYQTRILGGIQWFMASAGVDWADVGAHAIGHVFTGPFVIQPGGHDWTVYGDTWADNLNRPVGPVPEDALEVPTQWVSYTPLKVEPPTGDYASTADWAMVDFRVRTFELAAGDVADVSGWSVWPPTETRVDLGGPTVAHITLGAGDLGAVGLHLIGRTTLCAQANAN